MGEEAVRKAVDLGNFAEDKERQARAWLQNINRAREAEEREESDRSK